MANDITLGIEALSDFKNLKKDLKDTASGTKILNKELQKLVNQLTSVTHAMNKATGDIKTLSQQNAKLNKEKQKNYVTNKQLIQSETLLSAIYTKNSAVAQKKYLTSLTGMRQAMLRFRQESSKVLILEKGHVSLLDEQNNAMKRFMIQGNMVSRTLDHMSTRYLNLGKNLQWTGRQMMVGLTLPIVAFGGAAIRAANEWGSATLRVQKLLEAQGDTVEEQRKSLQNMTKDLQDYATALSQGNNKDIKGFGIPRTQIMDTMQYFAQIGAGVKEIKELSRLTTEFNLLGDLNDPTQAAETVRVLFQKYRSEFKDTNKALAETQKTIDIFNLIEDKTSLSMAGISEAVPKISNTLAQLNMTLPEGIAFLSAMTQNGVSATEAANALRFALTKVPAAGAYNEDPRLNGSGRARLKELTDAMERYNAAQTDASKRLDFFDAEGKFRGGTEALLQLSQAYGTMDDSMRAVFTRALTGTNQTERLGALFTNVSDSIKNSSSFAQDFAIAIGLSGDAAQAEATRIRQLALIQNDPTVRWRTAIEGVKNEFVDLGTIIRDSVLPWLEKAGEWFTKAVDWFRELPDGTKRWILSLVGVAAVIGPLTYGLGQLIILSASLLKMTFVKPIKAFFHLGQSFNDTIVKTGHAKDAINDLMAAYSSGKIGRNELKSGIEAQLIAEGRLRHEVDKTTAAFARQADIAKLTAQGIITSDVAMAATPNNMRGFGGISSAAVVPVQPIAPKLSSNLDIEDIKRDYPDVWRRVQKDMKRIYGTGAGGASPQEVEAAVKRRMGTVTSPFYDETIRESVELIRGNKAKITEIDRQLLPKNINRIDSVLASGLTDIRTHWNGVTDEMKAFKRDWDKFVPGLIKYTDITERELRDVDGMKRLFADLKTRLPQNQFGAISTSRNIDALLRNPKRIEQLGLTDRFFGSRSMRDRAKTQIADFNKNSGISGSELQVVPRGLVKGFIEEYEAALSHIMISSMGDEFALMDPDDVEKRIRDIKNTNRGKISDAFQSYRASTVDLKRELPGIMRRLGVHGARKALTDEMWDAMVLDIASGPDTSIGMMKKKGAIPRTMIDLAAKSVFTGMDKRQLSSEIDRDPSILGIAKPDDELFRIAKSLEGRHQDTLTNQERKIRQIVNDFKVAFARRKAVAVKTVEQLSDAFMEMYGVDRRTVQSLRSMAEGHLGARGDPEIDASEFESLVGYGDPTAEFERRSNSLAQRIELAGKKKTESMAEFRKRVGDAKWNEYRLLMEERERLEGEIAEARRVYNQRARVLHTAQPTIDGKVADDAMIAAARAEEEERINATQERATRRARIRANRIIRSRQRREQTMSMMDTAQRVRTQATARPQRLKRMASAIFSAGFFGSLTGAPDEEELRARAQLDQRTGGVEPSRYAVKRQRRLNRMADAAGQGAPTYIGPMKRESFVPKTVAHPIQATKKALSGVADVAKKGVLTGGKGILSVSTWAAPGVGLKKAMPAISKFGNGLKGLAMGGDNLLAMFTGINMLGQGGLLTGLGSIAGFLPVIALVAGAVLLIWKNWDKVSKGIGGGIDALKKAFMAIINAVVEPFRKVFDRLTSDGEGMSSMWESIGKIINVVSHGIAIAFKLIAVVIRPIFRILAELFNIFVRLIQFVVAVFTGQWGDAWNAIRDIVASAVQIMGEIIMLLPSLMVRAIGAAIGFLADVVNKLPKRIGPISTGVGAVVDKLNDAADATDRFGRNLSELPEDFANKLRPTSNSRRAQRAGERDGDAYRNGAGGPPNLTPEGDTDAAAAAGEDDGKAYVDSFKGAFQSEMRRVVDGWKEAALSAYDDWASQQIAAIDDQIAAIHALTKAEEEAARKREYLRRKEELALKRRELNTRYQEDRRKAIYEGRYDDAAILDMEYGRDSADLEQEIADSEEEHQKELTRIARDGEVQRLTDLKEEKKKQLDVQKEALEKQLAMMTEFIPKNRDAAAAMQQAILGALGAAAPGYSDAALTAHDAWKESWDGAWDHTKAIVANDAWWAGRNALNEFAKGFGIEPEQIQGGEPPAIPKPNMGGGLGENRYNPTGRPEAIDRTISAAKSVAYRHAGGGIGSVAGAPQDVPATLQTGEYVVQRSAVAKYGTSFLNALNEGRIYHAGGAVDIARGGLRKAVRKISSRFFSGSTVGGLTWDKVQDAYRSALGGFTTGESTVGKSVAEIVDKMIKGIHPEFQKRLEKWNAEMGGRFDITHGYRSMAQQQHLYDRWINRVPGQAPAAPPGKSMHNFGLAVDLVPSSTTAAQRAAGVKYGIRWPMSYEPWHVEPNEAKEWRKQILDGSVPGSTVSGLRLMANLFGGGTNATGDAKSIVKSMLGSFGWGEDQWPSLEKLVQGESGWNPLAANPTSSARGLFQKMTSIHGPIEPTVQGQAQWGLNYIKQRYGSPAAAFAKWSGRNPHWYHEGSLVQLKNGGSILSDGIAKVHKKESVLTAPLSEDLAKGIKMLASGDFGGTTVKVEIGQFFGTDREIEKFGRELERVMAKVNRSKGNATRTFSKP